MLPSLVATVVLRGPAISFARRQPCNLERFEESHGNARGHTQEVNVETCAGGFCVLESHDVRTPRPQNSGEEDVETEQVAKQEDRQEIATCNELMILRQQEAPATEFDPNEDMVNVSFNAKLSPKTSVTVSTWTDNSIPVALRTTCEAGRDLHQPFNQLGQ